MPRFQKLWPRPRLTQVSVLSQDQSKHNYLKNRTKKIFFLTPAIVAILLGEQRRIYNKFGC